MQAPHNIDAEKWRAIALQMRAWLCAVLLWLAEWFGEHRIGRSVRAELRADLRDAQRELRGIIVLLALTRVSWTKVPGCRAPPPAAFVRARSRADLRHCGRIVRFRARTLRGRLQRLHDVIDNLAAHIARMVKRLEAGFRQLGPILFVLLALRAEQATVDAAIADSS